MTAATARANLVDRLAAAQVLATVPRRELEDALGAGDGPVGLVLDVTRRPGPGTATVFLSWNRDDLEELLHRADGEAVTLAFDADELRRGAERDVEPHGIRQVAAVLAVAVVAGTAAGAAAQPGPPADDVVIDRVRVENGYVPPAATTDEDDATMGGDFGPTLLIE